MKLYQLLAAEYTKLFPSSAEKASYTEDMLSSINAVNILDLGCASGEFAFQLAAQNRSITGIDPDEEMIRQAQSMLTESENISFICDDMLSFLSSLAPASFDAITCMGNTLVYLNGEEELKEFLFLAKRRLRRGGKLLLQVLNYDNPAIREGFTFPVLESDQILFRRSYGTLKHTRALAFCTTVTDKVTGEHQEDTHRHFPFTSGMIRMIAQGAGFSNISIHGGYNHSSPDEADFFRLLILQA